MVNSQVLPFDTARCVVSDNRPSTWLGTTPASRGRKPTAHVYPLPTTTGSMQAVDGARSWRRST